VGNAANATSGTLGGFLKDRKTSTSHLFSCSHVFGQCKRYRRNSTAVGATAVFRLSRLLRRPYWSSRLTAPSGFHRHRNPITKSTRAAGEVKLGSWSQYWAASSSEPFNIFLPATSIPIGPRMSCSSARRVTGGSSHLPAHR